MERAAIVTTLVENQYEAAATVSFNHIFSLSLSVSFRNTKIQIGKVKNTKRPSWKTNMRPYLSISSWIDFEIQNTAYWENAKKQNIITSSGHIFHSFIFPNPSVREIQNTKKQHTKKLKLRNYFKKWKVQNTKYPHVKPIYDSSGRHIIHIFLWKSFWPRRRYHRFESFCRISSVHVEDTIAFISFHKN